MRILQLTNKVPWPPKDGGAIAILTLSKAFFLRGNQVTVLAMNTKKHHIRIEEIPEHLAAEIQFQLVDVPAIISTLGAIKNFLFSELPYNAERFINEDYSLNLIQLLKENEYDVIQLEGLYMCPYIPLIRRHSKALISYRAHNIEHEIWKRSASVEKGMRSLYMKIFSSRLKKFEKKQLNEYDVLVPITERDGLKLDEMGNKKPRHVTQTGIDLSSLVPSAKNLEFPSLFHIGSLDWIPNQEGLIWFLNHVWEKLHAKHPQLKFYIAGRNAPAWLVQTLKVDGVVYLGEVEDAYEFMNSKAIMVVPLRSGSGMRVKIVEAMALGKVIISTTIGSEGILSTDHKNILIANEPDEFIRSVEEVLDNRNLHDKIGKNAIRFIHDKFDNLAIVDKLIEFYKQQLNV